MRRDALVIGINRYNFLKDTETQKPKHLTTPATDAEDIARLLETYGSFEVQRLPLALHDRKPRVDRDPPKECTVTVERLQEAIRELFVPKSQQIPAETALLFFAGHGLRKTTGEQPEGYLATSDTNPGRGTWGISLRWLRELLHQSQVRQQIIWLDCCHSGEFLNFIESDLGEFERGRAPLRGSLRDRCFIAASRDFEVAYAAADGEQGILTGALLQGLNPMLQPDKWVTNYSLVDFVKQALKDAPQHPICKNSGGEIILTGIEGVLGKICPYKGLDYFDFNPEVPLKVKDPQYFCGRTNLTNQLLEKVRDRNFLAILGASGSGKSSVVRAGLLYQLYLGEALPGSDRWKIYQPLTPGEHPLQSLEQAMGAKAELLEALVQIAAAERVVFVIDQFEEVFTLCRDESERQAFFETLMGAVAKLGNKLCLLLVLRDDFQHKCAEQKYAGLSTKIDENLVRVGPMTSAELREAIVLPAEKVGLEIERELVTQILADVEGSPGDLPLLQYILTAICQGQKLNRLALSDYTRLGGVKKALEKQANEVYQSLNAEERNVAKQIFLALTRLAEDENTEDTRQPICLKDFASSQPSEELVNRVFERLVKAKLAIAGQKEIEGKQVAIANIAHEALIRHWQQLRDWLEEDRSFLLWHQDLRFLCQAWVTTNAENPSRRDKEKLLRGNDLRQAERQLRDRQTDLSSTERAFIRESREWQRHTLSRQLAAQAETMRLQQPHRVQRSVLLAMEAMKQFPSLEAERALRRGLAWLPQPALSIAPKDAVDEMLFSSDSQFIATVHVNHFIRVWDATTGEELAALEHPEPILALAFSPDCQYLTTADRHSARVWEIASSRELGQTPLEESIVTFALSPDGRFLASVCEKIVADENAPSSFRAQHVVTIRNLKGDRIITQIHKLTGGRLEFSPNGELLALAGNWGTSWVWETRTGQEVARLTTPIGGGEPPIFSPEGRYLAITDTVWDVSAGREIPQLQGRAIAFSPDSRSLATLSAARTVSVWEISSAQKIISVPHEGSVKAVAFSPDGKYLTVFSDDNLARVWEIETVRELARIADIVKVAWSGDGQLAAIAAGGKIWVWPQTIPASRKVTRLHHRETVWQALWNPNGQYFATASDAARVWETRSGREIAGLRCEASVKAIAFSPDSQYLAAGSWDKTARIWEINSSREVLPPLHHEGFVEAIAFSPNGDYSATASKDCTATIWAFKQGQVVRLTHDSVVRAVIFSQNGRYLATASGSLNTGVFKAFESFKDVVQVWEVPSGKLIASIAHERQGTVTRHRPDVNAIAFSPDSRSLATASNDGTARLWEVTSGREIKCFPHPGSVRAVAFSPTGEYLATASDDGTAKLWEVGSRREIAPPLLHEARVNAIAFNPDGRYLVTASDDSTVRVWETTSGKEVIRLNHNTAVWSVNFSPDEQYLLSVTADADVYLWRWLPQEDLLAEACIRLTCNLPRTEWEAAP